ncbi:MAG: hypothetical protein M1838_000778 [Thelocarpon superellum]|nr:MAG: hypothetical protein M1838_000778 [Thelocarpon superellum]
MFGPDGTARPPLDPSAPSAPSRGDPGPRHAQSALRVAPGSGGALNPGTRARHLHHPSLPEAQGTARPAPSARVDPTQSLAVAYLHPDLVFAKASASFCDALHARDLGLDGRSLQDVVQPSDWPKLDRLRRDLHFEREAHRSHRLPPISGRREDEAIMAVRDEDLAEVTSDFIERSDELAFLVDGHIIKCTVRLRLAQTSVYFVVMLLPVNTSRGQLGRGSLSPFPPPPYVGLATPGPPPLIFPAHPLPGRPVARGYSDPSPHSSRVPWRGRTAGLPWGDFHGRVESPAGPPGDPVPGEPYQSSPALSSAPSHRSGPSLPPSGVTTPRRLSVAYEAPGLALQWDVQLAPIRGPVPGSSEYPPRSRPPATEATAASPRKRSRVSVEEMLE